MLKNKLRLRRYTKIIAIVLLMSCLKFPLFAEPLTELPQSLNENETRYYTDLEIDLLIDDLTAAALEAIEQAAGEAARAAFLQSLEREAAALHEAQHWRNETEILRKAGIRNNVLIGVICFVGGLVVGVVGTVLISR